VPGVVAAAVAAVAAVGVARQPVEGVVGSCPVAFGVRWAAPVCWGLFPLRMDCVWGDESSSARQVRSSDGSEADPEVDRGFPPSWGCGASGAGGTKLLKESPAPLLPSSPSPSQTHTHTP